MIFRRHESLDYKPNWKSMSFSAKVQYIIDYYKLPIALCALLLCVAGYGVYRYVTRTNPILYVTPVNIGLSDEMVAELTGPFTAQEGYGRRDRVVCEGGLIISSDESGSDALGGYVSQVKLMASASADMLDVFLMDREAFDTLSARQFLLDLETYEGEGRLPEAALPHLTSNTVILEDNAEEVFEDPSIPYQTETESVLTGLDISGTRLFADGAQAGEVYLGIAANSRHIDTALAYVEFLFSEE